MSSMIFRSICANAKFATNLLIPKELPTTNLVRFRHIKLIPTPKPAQGKQYRRLVHYPENNEYTIKPLSVTNLAGRDPVTGRVVCKGIGGGIKYKYHWIQWIRDGPTEGPPKVDKVLKIWSCAHRTAHIALVGGGDQLKYILATENMKPGDLIKTSREIPRIPIRANEGDAYPLGALQIGTRVHCVERYPGILGHMIRAAGTFGTILRKFRNSEGEGYVVVQIPGKRELAFKENCMATVGRLSNIMHSETPIGSPNRNRELGNRPRSGLWQRKTGRFGRKIKRLPPMRIVGPPKEREPKKIVMTSGEYRYAIRKGKGPLAKLKRA